MSDSRSAAADPEALAALAERALETGEEERAIPLLRAAAERHRSALLWQWTGLLERANDEHERALHAFGEAARLAPDDAKIAQSCAQTAMEAGLSAVDLFERAFRLAPQSGAVLIGLIAARVAAGDGGQAASDLAMILDRQPLWTDGHEQYAQLVSTLGEADRVTETLERAIARMPAEASLWETLLRVQLRRADYAGLDTILARARSAGADSRDFAFFEAIHAAEVEEALFPPALFDEAPREFEPLLALWRTRHLLRVGAVDAALPIIDQGLAGVHAAELWPYASTAWRLAGDPRWQWLEGDPRLVRTVDLAASLPPLGQLADTLRSLHVARGEYLDQSVRGGTQTDGPLLSRIDPVIRQLRRAIVDAVRAYVADLPPIDPSHPLLRHRRDRRIRFAGSWSVRLRSGGRHSNHVHPAGWISSALYVALPERRTGEPADAGWLTLGQPDAGLGLDVPPNRKIEPLAGRLVLFPSWMWHGTLPFAQGERLTVAFDVSPPL